MAELTEQEKQTLAEMKAETVTEGHIKAASNFMGSMPYTHMALIAMAVVSHREFECDEVAQLLKETAEKIAAIECRLV